MDKSSPACGGVLTKLVGLKECACRRAALASRGSMSHCPPGTFAEWPQDGGVGSSYPSCEGRTRSLPWLALTQPRDPPEKMASTEGLLTPAWTVCMLIDDPPLHAHCVEWPAGLFQAPALSFCPAFPQGRTFSGRKPSGLFFPRVVFGQCFIAATATQLRWSCSFCSPEQRLLRALF